MPALTTSLYFVSSTRVLYCANDSGSGYDFGYFVKLLTAESLPTSEELFFEKLRKWFPTIYDIKFMMRACKVLKGGLQDVADDLGVSCFENIVPYEDTHDA